MVTAVIEKNLENPFYFKKIQSLKFVTGVPQYFILHIEEHCFLKSLQTVS